jgi:hypothetical protein
MNGRLSSDGPSISDPVEVKQLVAEPTLDKTMPQSVLSKNGEALTAWSDRRAYREPLSNQSELAFTVRLVVVRPSDV